MKNKKTIFAIIIISVLAIVTVVGAIAGFFFFQNYQEQVKAEAYSEEIDYAKYRESIESFQSTSKFIPEFLDGENVEMTDDGEITYPENLIKRITQILDHSRLALIAGKVPAGESDTELDPLRIEEMIDQLEAASPAKSQEEYHNRLLGELKEFMNSHEETIYNYSYLWDTYFIQESIVSDRPSEKELSTAYEEAKSEIEQLPAPEWLTDYRTELIKHYESLIQHHVELEELTNKEFEPGPHGGASRAAMENFRAIIDKLVLRPQFEWFQENDLLVTPEAEEALFTDLEALGATLDEVE